ncbi:hypothetical protein DCAR_0726783 [Daucus carota subsp. sativus]|uniref:Uncharacterized protein n=1 Tax=Daucus carota subsp. sativus TaxID=79200 RepID=A0A161Y259_DAUCS|nr:hypothetical protein DCAR_0726783 [Daucus carota subsp. sativus]
MNLYLIILCLISAMGWRHPWKAMTIIPVAVGISFVTLSFLSCALKVCFVSYVDRDKKVMEGFRTRGHLYCDFLHEIWYVSAKCTLRYWDGNFKYLIQGS